MTEKRYLLLLSVLFLVIFVGLGIAPFDRSDWALENVLVLVFVVAFYFSYQKLALSKTSYNLLFAFLSLHEIGSHYTYALVPYNEFFQFVFGVGLNEILGFERNHFDRLAHFLYGLLLFYPLREICCRLANVQGFWGYFLTLNLVMSSSMIFELFEWLAVILFAGDLGIAFLGTQGDIWDAHKDMLLASLGAFIAMWLMILRPKIAPKSE